MDGVDEDFVRKRVEEGNSHAVISEELQTMFPGLRGLSERSVRRFCTDRGISRRCSLTKEELERCVSDAVSEVGPSYGRKTMTGLLAAKGIQCSHHRVGAALKTVSPDYAQSRRQGIATLLNPMPYRADYFGEKLHVDQNEKLAMFGVTHVAGVDGFSSKVVGLVTMPVKNNVAIYEHLYRPVALQYGLWDQIRVDRGREFYLMLAVQDHLSDQRENTSKAPSIQSPSTKNHMIERLWVEINNRVNYPVKDALIQMQSRGLIDMDCEITKFCVSHVTMRVAQVGASLAVSSWNKHRIPKLGIPDKLMEENNMAKRLRPAQVPTAEEAVSLYEQSGGTLTLFGDFGIDPVEDHQQEQRLQMFQQRFPSSCERRQLIIYRCSSVFQRSHFFIILVAWFLESP
ncbi:uncharacterized protein LOC134176583 [Corticium candelabrum]|uniref:uncharacterized protein LOC134176583 n=1 Tax=Corticium candelabrum TaxID=121492 RepID=UPI002E272D52|nr:uncharacterized protein LOC134176583 [Corticium candelabrum]